jgi:hypothetical protein
MSFSKAHAENSLASLLWLTMVGCAATLPELKRPLASGEELVSLATRPGVTARVPLVSPKPIPKGTFLFFPGTDGFSLDAAGRPRWGYTRVFPERGFIAAIVDVPSDRPYGMWAGDRFRRSEEHVENVKKIIDFVSQKRPKLIFLIGHSAGTTSVAYLATVLL